MKLLVVKCNILEWCSQNRFQLFTEQKKLSRKHVSKDNLRVRRKLRNLENSFNPGANDEDDDNTQLRRLYAW